MSEKQKIIRRLIINDKKVKELEKEKSYLVGFEDGYIEACNKMIVDCVSMLEVFPSHHKKYKEAYSDIVSMCNQQKVELPQTIKKVKLKKCEN